MKKEVIMSAFLGLACTGILLSSCSENNDDPSSKPDRTTTDEMYYANQFARDMLETYYGNSRRSPLTGSRNQQ